MTRSEIDQEIVDRAHDTMSAILDARVSAGLAVRGYGDLDRDDEQAIVAAIHAATAFDHTGNSDPTGEHIMARRVAHLREPYAAMRDQALTVVAIEVRTDMVADGVIEPPPPEDRLAATHARVDWGERLATYAALRRRLGRVPSRTDMDKEPGLPSGNSMIKKYLKISNIARAAEIHESPFSAFGVRPWSLKPTAREVWEHMDGVAFKDLAERWGGIITSYSKAARLMGFRRGGPGGPLADGRFTSGPCLRCGEIRERDELVEGEWVCTSICEEVAS